MATKPRRPRDPNQLAALIVAMSVGDAPNDSPKGPDAPKTKGRSRGGAKGGRARALQLTPEQRREIAKTAALARWKK